MLCEINEIELDENKPVALAGTAEAETLTDVDGVAEATATLVRTDALPLTRDTVLLAGAKADELTIDTTLPDEDTIALELLELSWRIC